MLFEQDLIYLIINSFNYWCLKIVQQSSFYKFEKEVWSRKIRISGVDVSWWRIKAFQAFKGCGRYPRQSDVWWWEVFNKTEQKATSPKSGECSM